MTQADFFPFLTWDDKFSEPQYLPGPRNQTFKFLLVKFLVSRGSYP